MLSTSGVTCLQAHARTHVNFRRRCDVSCRAYSVRKGEDEGESMVSLAGYLADRQGAQAPGVYAIYDSQRALQYVGFGQDIFSRMQEHSRRMSEDQRAYVRAKVFANAAMATEENMQQEAEHWILEEGGVLPPGNGVDAHLWAPDGASDEAPQPTASSSAPDVVISPFTRAQVHRTVGQVKGEGVEMTVASVDAALEEVRPFLRADGGDVEVVSVADGNVFLRLEGNCGTCKSSSATMSMGVERCLRAAFGEQLREVVQVDKPPAHTTARDVDELLNMLRPAIANYRGKVDVLSLEGGVCRVAYEGPEPIWVGVRAAIRDKFADIAEIVRA